MRPIVHQREKAFLITKQSKHVIGLGNYMKPYLPGGAELLELSPEYLTKELQTRIAF